jgi:hypothetical protein
MAYTLKVDDDDDDDDDDVGSNGRMSVNDE